MHMTQCSPVIEQAHRNGNAISALHVGAMQRAQACYPEHPGTLHLHFGRPGVAKKTIALRRRVDS